MERRAVRPFFVLIKLRRYHGDERHLFAIARGHCVYVCVLVGFDQVSVGVGRFHLLNMHDRISNRAIIGARTSDGRSVAFVNIRVQSRVAIRSRRAFIREVLNQRDQRSRRHASNKRVYLFSRDARFLLYITRFRALPRRCRQTLYAIGWFNDHFRNLQIDLKCERVATCRVRFHERVFNFLRLNVFYGIRRCQSQTSTFHCVGNTNRHP